VGTNDHVEHEDCHSREEWYLGTTQTNSNIELTGDLWKLDVTNWFSDLKDETLTTLHEFVIIKDVSETSPGWKSLLLLCFKDNLAVVQHVDKHNKEDWHD
jgi:hypothetical protein